MTLEEWTLPLTEDLARVHISSKFENTGAGIFELSMGAEIRGGVYSTPYFTHVPCRRDLWTTERGGRLDTSVVTKTSHLKCGLDPRFTPHFPPKEHLDREL